MSQIVALFYLLKHGENIVNSGVLWHLHLDLRQFELNCKLRFQISMGNFRSWEEQKKKKDILNTSKTISIVCHIATYIERLLYWLWLWLWLWLCLHSFGSLQLVDFQSSLWLNIWHVLHNYDHFQEVSFLSVFVLMAGQMVDEMGSIQYTHWQLTFTVGVYYKYAVTQTALTFLFMRLEKDNMFNSNS